MVGIPPHDIGAHGNTDDNKKTAIGVTTDTIFELVNNSRDQIHIETGKTVTPRRRVTAFIPPFMLTPEI
jgi:hypothetical protein